MELRCLLQVQARSISVARCTSGFHSSLPHSPPADKVSDEKLSSCVVDYDHRPLNRGEGIYTAGTCIDVVDSEPFDLLCYYTCYS